MPVTLTFHCLPQGISSQFHFHLSQDDSVMLFWRKKKKIQPKDSSPSGFSSVIPFHQNCVILYRGWIGPCLVQISAMLFQQSYAVTNKEKHCAMMMWIFQNDDCKFARCFQVCTLAQSVVQICTCVMILGMVFLTICLGRSSASKWHCMSHEPLDLHLKTFSLFLLSFVLLNITFRPKRSGVSLVLW